MKDRGALIGLLVGLGGLLGGAVVESGGPSILASLANVPAFMIVVLGTLGAAIVSFPLERIKGLRRSLPVAFREPAGQDRETVDLFVRLAERARREGLLALENDVAEIEDPFIRKGVLLVVDGTDPELVDEVLASEVEAMSERHEQQYAILESMGGFAPTMGIIGTVMGLINVLSHLDKPDTLGHSIAVAFIATLYGVATANVLWLPLGQRLKQRSKEEARRRNLVIEGIMAVQAGDNPRVVREKLEALLPTNLRKSADEPADEAAPAASGATVAEAA